MFLYQLRHAFRRLLREPTFTVAAVLTLSLGVGANVAVFTVVEALLFRPLPYPNADELFTLRHRDENSGITKPFIAIGDYVDLAARESVFSEIAAYGTMQAPIFGSGDPYQVSALSAAPELLAMLALRPVVGRSFTPEEGVTGASSSVILGYDLWRTRFGSDPSVVGRSIRVGDRNRTIVGVAPEQFRFPPRSATDIIVNQEIPAQAPANRKSGWTFALAHIEKGRTLAEVNADLARSSEQLAAEFPGQNEGSTYYAQSLRDTTLGASRTPLMLLLAAVGVLLLIACANVANLLLARSLGRRRELAVRLALGAGRSNLVRQLLFESLALSLVSGLAGLVLAVLGGRALAGLVPDAVAPPEFTDVGINGPVLAFTLAVVVLTAVGCGLVAALSAPMENAAQSFLGSTKSTAPASARRATSALVVAEVALAVVLLMGAGLILRSFAALISVDPGFQVDRVLTMNITIPADRYSDLEARENFWQRAFEAIREVPGVRAVGAAVVTPLTGNNWTVGLQRTDQPLAPGERPPEVGWQLASGGYFRALRIPLISGRFFDEQDRPGSRPVVVVSKAIERRYFPGGSALGHTLRVGDETAEIVGVAGDIRRAGLRDEPGADLYFPLEQNPGADMTLFVHTGADPAGIVQPVQAALREVERDALLQNPKTLDDIAADSIRDTRLLVWLLGLFASIALVLAAVGTYGVMAYAVRQRTREIGTRVALGAQRHAIVWMVVRHGGTIALAGVAAGMMIAAIVFGALRSLLFSVSAFDPIVLVAATGALVVTTLLACYIPARRAAGVDPARILQDE